jgi:hypothetical protein
MVIVYNDSLFHFHFSKQANQSGILKSPFYDKENIELVAHVIPGLLMGSSTFPLVLPFVMNSWECQDNGWGQG